MAIGRISGPMLFSNLERQGIDLAFQGNLIYLDVTNSNVGINTSTPNADLQVVGTTQLSNIHVRGNAITSTTGKVDLGFDTNVIIRGGSDGYILSTDGAGNISWATLSSLATQFGNIVLNENDIQILELNGNLNLYANGTGNIVAHNNFYAPNVFVGNLATSGNITAPWFLGNIISDYANFANLELTELHIANTTITSYLTKIENVQFYGNTVEGINGSLYLSANTAADANAIVKFTGTKAIDIPSGSDAERPLNPDLGYIRFNSERGTLEWWSGTTWIQGQSYIEDQTIMPDGVNSVFTLDSAPPSATSILVSINGTVQRANVAYTVAGNQITFSEMPLDSDIIDIRYLAATGLATSFVGGNLTGNIYISSNANSYSSSTGGLIVVGGTGIGGNLFVGGNIIATSGNASTSIDTGALVVVGGAGVSGNLFVGGNIVAASGEVSTSTNTGALVVIGGAGISGNLYITNTGDVSANIGAFQAYANNTFSTSTYGNLDVAAYLSSDPTIVSINSNVANVQANFAAFEIYANASFTTGNYGDSNVAAYLPTDANLLAFFNYANVTFDQVFTQQDAIDGNLITSKQILNANIGTIFNRLNTLNANVGAYQLYANANIGTLHNGNISTQANIGTIFNRLNTLDANVGVLHLGNISTQANLGLLYESNISTQANIGTLFLGNVSTQANIGSIRNQVDILDANVGVLHLGNISTQANLGTLHLGNVSTQANLGAFQLYANSKIGNNSNSNLVVIATTEATSIDTGALVVKGGAGIAGNLYVGGNLIVSNVSYEYREIISTTQLVQGNIVAASGTGSTSVDTGALVVVGGAGVSGSLFITNTNDVSANIGLLHNANIAVNANLGAFQTFVLGNLTVRDNNIIDINANLGAFQTYANSKIGSNSNSNIVVVSTDPSTSINTGAIVTLGGAGIAGNLNVGQIVIASGNIVANSGVASTNINTGALVVKGGAGVSGNVHIAGNIVAAATTESVNTVTGALVVRGGAGIAGNLSLGGNLSLSSNIYGSLRPAINSNFDIGTPFFKWRDLYLSGGVSIDGETNIGQDLYVTGQVISDSVATNSVDAGTVAVQSVTVSSNLIVSGRVNSNLIPAVSSIYDIGAPFYKWRDLHLAGDVSIDGDTNIGQNLDVTGQVISNGVSTNSVDVTGTVTATSLAGTITTAAQPNITQVGTITSGTWNGSAIPITHGGTGATSISQALNNLLPSGEDLGYVLTTGGPGIYYWSNANVGGGGGGGTLSGIFVESSRTYYTATLGQTAFTTTGNYTPGSGQLRIYQNGVRQFNSEYTEIDGNTFSLSTACAAGDVILAEIDGFNYLTVYAANVVYSPVGGIPAGAVTAQLAIDNIETRKVDRAGDTMTGPLIVANANVATSTSTGALQVQGGAGIGGNLYIGGSQSTAIVATGNVNVLTGNVNATAGTIYGGRVFSAGSNVLIATSNVATQVSSLGVGTAAPANIGEIRATNDIIAYYSDDRLKTRLGNIEHALDKVKSLAGFHYHANELAQSLGYEPKPEVGVSAQEVQRVFPEIVVPAPIDENYLTVKYEKLIPVLIEAIKELSEEIDTIKRKLNDN